MYSSVLRRCRIRGSRGGGGEMFTTIGSSPLIPTGWVTRSTTRLKPYAWTSSPNDTPLLHCTCEVKVTGPCGLRQSPVLTLSRRKTHQRPDTGHHRRCLLVSLSCPRGCAGENPPFWLARRETPGASGYQSGQDGRSYTLFCLGHAA